MHTDPAVYSSPMWLNSSLVWQPWEQVTRHFGGKLGNLVGHFDGNLKTYPSEIEDILVDKSLSTLFRPLYLYLMMGGGGGGGVVCILTGSWCLVTQSWP